MKTILRPWMNLPIVVIDFETTGPDPEVDEPVEIGVARFERGELIHSFSRLLWTDRIISEEAYEVHGISNDLLRTERAALLQQVLQQSADMFNRAIPAAYNASFDHRIFHRHANLQGLRPMWFEDDRIYDPEWPWLDPLVWVREIDKFAKGKKRHTLAATCARHGIEHDDEHSAEGDAIATGRLLWHLATNKIINSGCTIAEMLRRQQEHAEEQEREFRAWLAKQRKARGDEAD